MLKVSYHDSKRMQCVVKLIAALDEAAVMISVNFVKVLIPGLLVHMLIRKFFFFLLRERPETSLDIPP